MEATGWRGQADGMGRTSRTKNFFFESDLNPDRTVDPGTYDHVRSSHGRNATHAHGRPGHGMGPPTDTGHGHPTRFDSTTSSHGREVRTGLQTPREASKSRPRYGSPGRTPIAPQGQSEGPEGTSGGTSKEPRSVDIGRGVPSSEGFLRGFGEVHFQSNPAMS